MIRDIGSDYQVGYLRLVNSKDRQTITSIQVHLIGRSRPKPRDGFVRDIGAVRYQFNLSKLVSHPHRKCIRTVYSRQLANVEA